MLRIVRHALFVLIAFAIIGGGSAEFARSAQYDAGMVSTGVPCNLGTSASGESKPMAPCKGMTSDCIKQMGCSTVSVLPARFLTHDSTVRYSAVDYWTSFSELASLERRPEPLPPRTT
jgi:hypothetical protein